MRRGNSWLVALAMAGALLCSPARAQQAEMRDDRPVLALMGTVPIYWGEAAGLDELIQGDALPHWARPQLEAHFALAPLDYLSAAALANHRYLLMAQPRGLSPEENLALDDWVRAGGQLLLFVDPMMTGESRFHIGDRRRPQDVALLSPLLAHWGLELVFDPQQKPGSQLVDHHGTALPVNLRGTLQHTSDQPMCVIPGEGLLAHCNIGAGQALVVADAAMLDLHDPQPQAPSALQWLVSHVFGDVFGEIGDHAGNDAPQAGKLAEPSRNMPVRWDDGNHDEGENHAFDNQ